MSIATDSTTRPSSSAVPFSHWLHAPNSPALVSQPGNSDRTNESDPMNLPNGSIAMGRSTRYGTALPFRHRLRAPNSPGFVSQPRNLDRISLYDPPDLAAESTVTDSTSRRNTTTVPFSHWLHASDASDLVSQPRSPERSAQRFNDALNHYKNSQARDRMHARDRQTTSNGSNNYQNPYTRTGDGPNARASTTPNTKAETLLKSLPVLSLTDLPKDNQECPICLESYHDSPPEKPVHLPCSHVIGKDCLLRWLKTCALNAKNNTCPICRAILFDRDTTSPEEWVQRINDVLGQVPELSRPRVRNDVEGLERVAGRIPTTRGVNQAGERYHDRANQFDDRMIAIWETAGNTARAEEVRERRARRLRDHGGFEQGVGTERS